MCHLKQTNQLHEGRDGSVDGFHGAPLVQLIDVCRNSELTTRHSKERLYFPALDRGKLFYGSRVPSMKSPYKMRFVTASSEAALESLDPRFLDGPTWSVT